MNKMSQELKLYRKEIENFTIDRCEQVIVQWFAMAMENAPEGLLDNIRALKE
jgi:hypothetical protein